jgi:hypothetical protein
VILAARLAGHSSILGVATTIIITSTFPRLPSEVQSCHGRGAIVEQGELNQPEDDSHRMGRLRSQIVFYPRYLAYFDACTTAWFKKAGLSKRQMLNTHQIVGIPLVDPRASFKAPSRFSDTVTVVLESEKRIVTDKGFHPSCVRRSIGKLNNIFERVGFS